MHIASLYCDFAGSNDRDRLYLLHFSAQEYLRQFGNLVKNTSREWSTAFGELAR
jgi:hypothetical protein